MKDILRANGRSVSRRKAAGSRRNKRLKFVGTQGSDRR